MLCQSARYPLPIFSMKKFLGLSIIGSLIVSQAAFAEDAAFSQKAFTDVPQGSTYYEGIEYLRTQNVLKGYLDGTFRPNSRINRAEFVKFVINPLILDTNNLSDCLKANIPEGMTTVYFPDVSTDAWYAAEVCFAKKKEIINGYPDGTYRPAASINFVEAAKILSIVFSLKVEGDTTGEFWYRPYVQRLSDLHAIPSSIKRFDQIMTRGEMAEIVYRLKADREDKASASFKNIH